MAQKLVDKNLKPISTEKPEEVSFTLKGNVNYELTLTPDQFSFRGQLSNENNMCHLMGVGQFLDYLIQEQSKPTLQKKDKMNPKRFQDVKSAKRVISHYSELIATALYEMQMEKLSKPDIKVVSNEEFLKKKLDLNT